MDQGTRDEIDKLHGRISEVSRRVTVLETDVPHIRKSVDRMEGHLSWGTKIVVAAVIAALLALVVRSGAFPPI